jgi:type II secretory pathway pseudopilin PulG
MTSDQRGFTLVELLVSATITLAITGALLVAMSPADGVFSSELEAADEQQRLRVAAGVLFKDLAQAEAVFPAHRAAADGSSPGSFRSDAVTVYASSPWAETTLASALPAQSGSARINISAGCPLNDAVCGLSDARTVLVSDDTGAADLYRVDDVLELEPVLALRHTLPDSPKVYAAGSRIAGAVVRSYYLKTDLAGDTVQLFREDGDGRPGVPVVDHVTALAFEYFSGSPDALNRLEPSTLADGPWVPDSLSPNRFDADLLRVRSIGVTLRVEAALASLRGPAGPLFSRGGTSRRGSRFLPDLQVRLQIVPRNLGRAR